MILHIPHSSTNTLNYDISEKERELLRMTDHFTDELFTCSYASRVVFGLSRLICDVERFEDDEQEEMSKFGMGVCYTTDSEGKKLRDISKIQKKYLIQNYYRPHHEKLSNEVDSELKSKGTALVIDCHSFPDKSYYFNKDFNQKRPDICIGTDSFHTPKKLIQAVKRYFLGKGYDTRVDSPYTGTLIPMKHYKNDVNVHSIMIEINRKLYMDDEGTKTEHFDTLQGELRELLEKLKRGYDENDNIW